MQRALMVCLLLGVLATSASAQFFAFTDLDWTFVSSGSGSGNVSAEFMRVEGADGGGCPDGLVYFETTAPFSGTVRVHLDWKSVDLCHFDWPIWVLNGVPTPDIVGASFCDQGDFTNL